MFNIFKNSNSSPKGRINKLKNYSTIKKDFLKRRPLAISITNQLLNSSPNMNIVCGISGSWGSGKTTILEFICEIAAKENNPSIIIDVSQYKSFSDLNSSLKEHMKKHPVLKDKLRNRLIRYRSWLKEIFNITKVFSYFISNTADGELNLPQTFVRFVSDNLISIINPISSEEIKGMVDRLKEEKKRLFIVFENLDRADHNIIPQLLLSIKEFMNLEGVIYIIVYDRDITAQTLANYNRSYGSGYSFLDKIIDYPITLPPLSPHEKFILLQGGIDQFNGNRIDFNGRIINEISYLLPATPRKIIGLAKSICLNYGFLSSNFEENSRTFLYLSLIKEMSLETFKNICEEINVLEYNSPNSHAYQESIHSEIFPEETMEHEYDTNSLRKINGFIKNSDDASEKEKSLLYEIVIQWLGQISLHEVSNIKYVSNILLNKETHHIALNLPNILSNFLKYNCKTQVDDFIKDHTNNLDIQSHEIALVILEALINEITSKQLDGLNIILQDEYDNTINEASKLLDLFEYLWRKYQDQLFEYGFNLFLDYICSWHTSSNLETLDQQIRKKEGSIFKNMLSLKTNNQHNIRLTLHEKIRNSSMNPRLEFLKDCLKIVEYNPVEMFIAHFQKPDGIKSLISKYDIETRKLREDHNQLVLPNNIFQSSLMSLMSESIENNTIYNNLFYYLEYIEKYCPHFQFSPQEIVLLTNIWKTIVSRNLHLAIIPHLQKRRDFLIGRGMKDDMLPLS